MFALLDCMVDNGGCACSASVMRRQLAAGRMGGWGWGAHKCHPRGSKYRLYLGLGRPPISDRSSGSHDQTPRACLQCTRWFYG